MKFQSIEWLRRNTNTIKEFECQCHKTFDNFDDWWNHMWIEKHLILTDEDVDNIRRFCNRLGK